MGSNLFIISLFDSLLHWSQVALRLLRGLGHAQLNDIELLYKFTAQLVIFASEIVRS